MRGSWWLVALAACGRIGFDPHGDAGTGSGTGSDSGSDSGGDAAVQCTSFGPWGNVVHLDLLASSQNDWAPTLSDDGLVMVFDSGRTAGDLLYMSQRATTADAFGAPVAITNLNILNRDTSAASFVGNQLYYLVFDPVGMTTQINVATYLGNGMFSAPAAASPQPPGSAFAMTTNQLELFTTENPASSVDFLEHDTRTTTASAWTADSSLMYLTPGGQNNGWPSWDEARQTLYYETSLGDIEVVTRADPASAFGQPTIVSTIGPSNGDPEISRDGLTLLFASDRAGGQGLFDLYIATRSCQ